MNQLFRKLKKVRLLIRIPLWRHALTKGVAATTEHLHIFRQEPFATLIDAGANRGQFSLLLKGLYPDIKIFAFEPLSEPRNLFGILFKAYQDVKIFPYALAEKEASMPMNVAKKNDSSSLLNFTKVSEMFPSASFSHTEKVNVRRLDEVLDSNDLVSPVLLKIDVQGCEREVLLGSEELIKYIDVVYVEASFVDMYEDQVLFEELYEMLLDEGFYLKRIGHVSGSYLQPGSYGDFFFERRKKMHLS